MLSDKLTVTFGRPLHGWLPVSLAVGNFALEFTTSAVPTDPLAELAAALLLVTQEADAAVQWFLEPLEYHFELQPQAGGEVRLLICELAEGGKSELLLNLQASYNKVVLPFWRAVQKLNPADFGGIHWPDLPLDKLQKLRALVRARGAAG